MMRLSHTLACILTVLLLAAGLTASAQAHPMGNFAICHYAKITVSANKPLRLRYVLDMAEIPTVSERKAIDTNGDGTVSADETAAYLAQAAPRLVSGLTVTADQVAQTLLVKGSDVVWSPGAGGLQTLRIRLNLETANLLPPKGDNGQVAIEYRDTNYATRTGWKEILATTEGGNVALQNATVGAIDRSDELTRYPAGVIPPQEMEARLTVASGAGIGAGAPATTSAGTNVTNTGAGTTSTTPRDPFTEAIHQQQLTPGLVLLGLLVAFVYGGLHALGPGHGKTMVAAYLVGTRGTPRHAVLLGIIVTVTHTLGVFVLGAVTILAEKYIVPEKLYPYLSAFSGLSVVAVGGWLFYTRLRIATAHPHSHFHDHGHSHSHDHSHTHDHDHEHSHSHDHSHDLDDEAHARAHALGLAHTHSHDGEHVHDHSHDHDHSHSHSHDLDEMGGHDHGFGYHSHAMPEGPVTPRTLIALGISGGIVPCPSALIVLLAAIALNRVAYGMVLITAFSLGLASVLIAIGLMVVMARHWLERMPRRGLSTGRIRTVAQLLPIASAAAIVVIGVALVVRAFTGAP